LSEIATRVELQAVHPATGETLRAASLLTGEGIARMLSETVSNFTGFAPLGVVLVAMLGVGIAERAGLLGAALKALVLRAPPRLLCFTLVLAGVLSSLAADAGYVVLVPLGAMAFHAAGRNPLAGIAAAFAGVSAGFSANLLVGPIDAILAGISTAAAGIVDAGYRVEATGNYYFMVVSTLLVAGICTFVTEAFIEPRLGAPARAPAAGEDAALTGAERRALRASGWFSLLFLGIVLAGALPADAPLRSPDTGSLLANSPLIRGAVVLVAIYLALAGIVYGKVCGSLGARNATIEGMEATMATMAGYIVMMFFAAQFVAWFSWTNLGAIFAIKGANWLRSLDLSLLVLLPLLVCVSSAVNLLIGSASAKWAMMAPVFVPMLMLVGVAPETTQVAYRIGDSATNIITPLMPYFALVVAFIQRHEPRAGIGTVMALMLPYAFAILIGWCLLLIGWTALDLPLGPDAPMRLGNPAAAP